MQTFRLYLLAGTLLAAIAVACGAFGAHRLKSRFAADGLLDQADEQQLANWETAARYQMYHALALIALGLTAGRPTAAGNAAGAAFISGTVIFSGCLYALVITGERWLGGVVPLGGTLLIVGWICFAVHVATGQVAASRPALPAEE